MAACATVFLFLACVFVFVSADQKNITAESGQNVTLTCQALNNNIIVVEWSRADMEPEYVFVWRNNNYDSDNQHPSFKDRVDLQDRQMKDGDVSLILKDVNINDAGTYECRVFMRETRSWRSISTIYLVVVGPPGQPGGTTEDEEEEDGGEEDGGNWDRSVALKVGLPVAAVVLLVAAAAVGFVIYKKRTRNQTQASSQPRPVELQLLHHV